MSAINISDSLDAVPLPMAMAVTPWRRIMAVRVLRASSFRLCGGVGYTTPVSSTLPVSSTTAILQPVRYAGSKPIVTRFRSGGCISSGWRFCPKARMAASSAASVSSPRISRSADGSMRRRQASSQQAFTKAFEMLIPRNTFRRISCRASASSISTPALSIPSRSPRFTARTRWPCTLDTGSR